MQSQTEDIAKFLATLHPYDSMSEDARCELASSLVPLELSKGREVYAAGQQLEGLFLIVSGEVEVREPTVRWFRFSAPEIPSASAV